MPQVYVVKRGDTLRKIASRSLGNAERYREIAAFNGLRNPDQLAVGQRIEIPSRRDLTPPAPSIPAPTPVVTTPATATTGGALRPPHGQQGILDTFGDIYGYLRDDGTLDPRWEQDQLTRARLPFGLPLSWDPAREVRQLYCHKKLATLSPAAFAEVERRGLRAELRTFGGCFNFRSKRSSNKLSVHSWGIAIDLNPETNGMGSAGTMAPEIVDVFESFGFTWGGRWAGSSRDPMHFQFCSGY